MPFLNALGGFAGGLAQGLDQGSVIQQRAQQIQAAQFALDQQKRQLAGQAAAFQSLLNQAQQQQGPTQPPNGMGAPPMPQAAQTGRPPMPGQASVPNQPPLQMAPSGPQLPAGGGTSTPAPVPQPQPLPGQNVGQAQPGALPQEMTTHGQLNIIGQIAQAIKAQNPGIDSATLFEAVKAQIGLLGGLSQSQKSDLALTLEALRAQTSTQNVQTRAQTSEDVAQIGAKSRESVAAGHDATSRANAQDRIADADKRLNQTQAAINARQQNTLQGRADTKAQTERLAMLRTKLSQAKQKLAQASAQGSDTTQAQKAVDDAYNQILDFQTKVMGGKATPAAGKVVDFSTLPQ